MSGKTGPLRTHHRTTLVLYLHVDAPAYLYACVRVCGGMFAFECDSVYFVGPEDT